MPEHQLHSKGLPAVVGTLLAAPVQGPSSRRAQFGPIDQTALRPALTVRDLRKQNSPTA